ncbi:hypothetical protein GALL_22970 [mine drainage metagenome]|uniref:Uncharacterized protein n=1 Tax=mine drainage metagenome TaxID=410659 RepID=A0A1J5TU25_9ZZZZ
MATKYPTESCGDTQIHQCDLFRKVPFYERYKEDRGSFVLTILEFPLAIILTQECDLEQNASERSGSKSLVDGKTMHDKFLVSLLCAPLYNAEHLFSGNHLSFLEISSNKKSSEQKNYIKQNREPRYHYVEFDERSQIVPSVIDFKHYFSVSLEYLEDNMANRVCSIKPIFRESISQRFSNYLSRIGLPN